MKRSAQYTHDDALRPLDSPTASRLVYVQESALPVQVFHYTSSISFSEPSAPPSEYIYRSHASFSTSPSPSYAGNPSRNLAAPRAVGSRSKGFRIYTYVRTYIYESAL